MSVKEMVMLIIPSLVGVTGYGILQYYLMIYERDTGKNLIDTYGFYGALSFLHYLISIVAILVVIVMFQNWKEMQEEQRGQELVLNQISDMKSISRKSKSCIGISAPCAMIWEIIYRHWNIWWHIIIWMMLQNTWNI